MAMNMRIGALVNHETHQKLEALAKRRMISMSDMLRMMVRQLRYGYEPQALDVRGATGEYVVFRVDDADLVVLNTYQKENALRRSEIIRAMINDLLLGFWPKVLDAPALMAAAS